MLGKYKKLKNKPKSKINTNVLAIKTLAVYKVSQYRLKASSKMCA